MENITPYNISEFLAILFSVLIGSGAYISFVYIKNKVKVSLPYVVAVVLINFCLTYVASGLLKVSNWGKWSAPALTMVAFAGQYIADWIDKRYLKIFDTASKKAGFNLNNEKDDKDENNNTTKEDEDQ